MSDATSKETSSPASLPPSSEIRPLLVVDRYAIFDELGAGGMGTVHLGRLVGSAGFSRVVAIKRMHPHLAKEQEFASMFRDEVRLAARVQHPNVVATLDVVERNSELLLVMEYVHGEPLSRLIRRSGTRGKPIPPAIAASIACGILHGLHAAHEARSETDEPLGIVHRDVSPHNVLVGCDGVARVLDFGIARAAGRQQVTRNGQIKGKMSYLAPEVLRGRDVDRRADIFGVAVVLWEALTGARLFEGANEAIVLAKVLSAEVVGPRSVVPEISEALEAIVLKGLERDPDKRYATAREMALALQQSTGVLAPCEVGDWVAQVAEESLSTRARKLAELEKLGSLSSYREGWTTALPDQEHSWPGSSERPPASSAPAGEPSTSTVIQPLDDSEPWPPERSRLVELWEEYRAPLMVAVLGILLVAAAARLGLFRSKLAWTSAEGTPKVSAVAGAPALPTAKAEPTANGWIGSPAATPSPPPASATASHVAAPNHASEKPATRARRPRKEVSVDGF
jgi:eukaryotic-like serine/threonine-protein kinase